MTAVTIGNPAGLHARPAVKLTLLAKRFAGHVELALAEDGPWIDAKSVAQVMALRAAHGASLHLRGEDAAVAALAALVRRGFDDAGG